MQYKTVIVQQSKIIFNSTEFLWVFLFFLIFLAHTLPPYLTSNPSYSYGLLFSPITFIYLLI